MSSTSQLPNLDHIVWTKATTESGKNYEVGVTKAAAEIRSKAIAAGGLKPIVRANGVKEEFSIFIDWPVGDSEWKTTSSQVQNDAAITKYKLYEYDGYWKYVLHFVNTIHYDYQFKDASPDVYTCDTWTNDDHYIRFDSTDATMKKIMGR
ncbi:hypothetical protein SISNIDRAFT_552523 [Sistotremastrum niveocremeum HHB9708]|uniref:Uncharacterized protein n=1 Tax=Sistotremastrum niveocremeum HHB9708 TaxID=1314777 RepID=A0A164PCN6_9AGAM|nr:hypothetical protein SISNIDRAFT_552523 [Sistotremastrum niveocremeum HHB9708]